MRTSAIAALFAVLALAVASAPARPKPSACTHEITGTALPEALDGTPANDRILGLGGDDRLTGALGDDCLNGGFDSDQLLGGAGDDLLEGSNGNDLLEGGAGDDDLKGQQDSDRLEGNAGSDRLWGGGAGDSLFGGAGPDVLRGEGGRDRLSGGAGPDTLLGGAGPDSIIEVPRSYASGGPLDTGRNRVTGGPGNDRIDVANGRRDTVDCGKGRDMVEADKADRLENCERKHLQISPFPEVSPRRGGQAQDFLVKFRSIEAVGPRADWFTITVKGPPECGTLVTTSTGMAYHADRAVRARLQPFRGQSKMAKRWCFGRYRGAIAYSRTGEKDVPIGRFSFRVHG